MQNGEFESPWLKHLTASFAALAKSKTRVDAVRLKDWLHLSLAYDFQPAHAMHLKHLATALVDISAPVNWGVACMNATATTGGASTPAGP